jgi:uncharacterized protein YndB with AHSA1/START domain
MKLKFELEYTLNCSQKVLFSRLSTPEGLSEWFADNVNVDGDMFTFIWNNSESRARLSAMKENKLVRFEWDNDDDEEENYFEFRINIDELTGDLALLITDFADADEKEDSIYLWDSQINDLKRVLGI